MNDVGILLPEQSLSEDWKRNFTPSSENYTSDEVIDAYLKGKEDGLNQHKVVLMEKLKSNLLKTVTHRNQLYEFLYKHSFTPETSFLKISSVYEFQILIIIPEKEYLKESFLETYKYASEIEKKVHDDTYNVFFSFTNSIDELNDDCLRSEGYLLQHIPATPVIKEKNRD